MDYNQDPSRHPAQKRRCKHGRSVIEKQNQLEHGRLQLSLVAIRNVSSKIAEKVDIEDVVFVLARVRPPTEDKVLCGRRMRPKPMADRKAELVKEEEKKIASFAAAIACAGEYVPAVAIDGQNSVIFGQRVLLAINLCRQYALLDLEKFVLLQMKVSASLSHKMVSLISPHRERGWPSPSLACLTGWITVLTVAARTFRPLQPRCRCSASL